jgi:hypothetical protein
MLPTYEFQKWSADQHKTRGDELLGEAHAALGNVIPEGGLFLASLATAHYAAAQAIVAKHHAGSAQQVDSRWSWRGAEV